MVYILLYLWIFSSVFVDFQLSVCAWVLKLFVFCRPIHVQNLRTRDGFELQDSADKTRATHDN